MKPGGGGHCIAALLLMTACGVPLMLRLERAQPVQALESRLAVDRQTARSGTCIRFAGKAPCCALSKDLRSRARHQLGAPKQLLVKWD